MNEKQLVVDALSQALEDTLSKYTILNLLEKPKTSDHGDIAFPTFTLAKTLRKAPNLIASELADKIPTSQFEKVEVVGPYINFFLDKAKLSASLLTNILQKGSEFGSIDLGKGQNVPIDMSSPNIAKPMSMGHLRSTVIGNALANIMEKIGYKPIKINHLGDWGTQFGKLIVAYKKWGTKEEVEKNPIQELLRLYVEFHERAEEDAQLEDEARAWFRKLEDGDSEATELWQWFRTESLAEFNRVYKMLDITFDSYNGEAFYNDKMDKVIEELKEKNLLTTSQGAEVVDLEKYDLNPALIQKSDGATLYMTRDLAAAMYRHNEYNFAKSLYVVGNEQSMHFKQLKAVLKEMGYDWSDEIYHIPFGLITQGGKKLSTRKGKVILLEKVLNEAIESAKNQIQEKNPNLDNQDEIAHEVGVGAVVFHDLKNDRLNNFDFDLEEVVRFEGETGPYVQYTHARACSILRKANQEIDINLELTLSDEDSWQVIKLLQEFPETVQKAANQYEPSIIAKHAIHLAQAFNKYYAHVKILEQDKELNSRLALVKAVTIVLAEDLRLLGVKAPKEM